MKKEIKAEVVEHIGVISERSGWKKEINRISWNGREPKLDIREWNEDHSECHKGITITDEEANTLKIILNSLGK